MTNNAFLDKAKAFLSTKSPGEIIAWAAREFPEKVTYATSLGAEAQIILHQIAQHQVNVPIFTLDTGRLHQETYDLMDEVREFYKLEIRIYTPNHGHLEDALTKHGVNFFYNSPQDRQRCCKIRKVFPLQRALDGYDAWMTGVRQGQSLNRSNTQVLEWDEGNQRYKVNPLWNWSGEQVWNYIKTYELPYNKLHDQGFPSIGCAPCTRAIATDEDERSGRWWWEEPEAKECGLHMVNGQLVRKQVTALGA